MESTTDRLVRRIREEAVKNGLKSSDKLIIKDEEEHLDVTWTRKGETSQAFLRKDLLTDPAFADQIIELAMREFKARFR